MAVTKISNSGIKTGVLKYDSMLAGNAAYDPAATWLIQRTTLSTDTATVTFSSIPSNYQHLQIRFNARSTFASATAALRIRFNSDTTSANYVYHRLFGDGTTATAAAATSAGYIYINSHTSASATSNQFGVGIIDIHDYGSTTKNKTVRAFAGNDRNGGGDSNLISGLWINTAAVSSIELTTNGTSFLTGSTFALYGFIGA